MIKETNHSEQPSAMSQLQPLSNTSLATQAEHQTIFLLKRECKALKMAMKTLPKHGKEWTLLNSKLEIAKEELEATLEDMDITRNYSGGIEGSVEGEMHVPYTPPLVSPKSPSVRRVSPKRESLKRPVFGRQMSSPEVSHSDLFASLRPPSLEEDVDVNLLKHELERTEKFSLEYFKIKKKIDSTARRSGSLSISFTSGAPPLLKSKGEDATTLTSPLENERSIKVANGMHNLTELLDAVPKYSLEWFNLKKEIKVASDDFSKQRTFSFDTSGSDTPTNSVAFKKSKSRKPFRRRSSPDLDSLDAQYHYVRMRHGVVAIQKLCRCRVQRSKFIELKVAAICIQAVFRKAMVRKRYVQSLNAVILIQSYWRGHLQRVHLRIVTSEIGMQLHTPNSEEEDEDILRMQRSIMAMKEEKMTMEMKLLQLKNDIDTIKNDNLRDVLIRMQNDIESLEHVNNGLLFDTTDSFSLVSAPSNVFSVVLNKPGYLGMEMEHHKTTDSVIVANVKRKSQADKAGLQRGDIVVGFRSADRPDGMSYAQFIDAARRGVRPLVLDLTRVDPELVGSSSRRTGFFKKKQR
jgi:hypothetical protein